MKLVQTVEGKTKLYVPRTSLEMVVPPTAPVFFNPAASTNRDVSVAVADAVGGRRFCDALAGVGARGLRVATEVPSKMEVTMVDFNGEALKLAERSAKANDVKGSCTFVCEESRTFLHSKYGRGDKFDFVDVDPFGSPAPFFQAMISATTDGGVMSATATDTAALCGVYPLVCRRRYGATPLNNHFHHETAARVLLNAIRAQAATFDRGIVPLAAHSTRHYIRVYARVVDGAKKADEALVNVGYVTVCEKCFSASGNDLPLAHCPECHGPVAAAGPLWKGRLTDDRVLARARDASERFNLMQARKVLDSLVQVDSFPPWSYDIDQICSDLGIATVSESSVRRHLSEFGFASARQPFEKSGLKTKAPFSAVRDAVKQSVQAG